MSPTNVDRLFEEFIISLIERTKNLQEAILASAEGGRHVVSEAFRESQLVVPAAKQIAINSASSTCWQYERPITTPKSVPFSPKARRGVTTPRTPIPRTSIREWDEALQNAGRTACSRYHLPKFPNMFERVPSLASHSPPEDPPLPLNPVLDILGETYQRLESNQKEYTQTVKNWLTLAQLLLKSTSHTAKLCSIWLIKADIEIDMNRSLDAVMSSSMPVVRSVGDRRSDRTGDTRKHEKCYVKYAVRHPDKAFASVYASIVCAVVLFELVTFPLVIASETEHTPYWNVFMLAAWFTSAFWSLDVLMSCFQGFYTTHGIVEMRVHYIAWHYLKTWCLIDCIVNLADWVSCATMSANTHETGVFHLFKILRFLRLFRIARLLHAMNFLRTVFEGLLSDHIILYTRLLRSLTVILLISHYISCAWCALALRNNDNSSWIQAQGLENQDFLLQYLSSLHWSLTQFTPATNNIAPTNGQERLFAIVVVFFGLIMFSAFVSNLTSNVTELKKLKNVRSAEEAQIMLYMRKKRFPLSVYKQIWDYYKAHYKHRKGTSHEFTITFFQQLPTSLRRVVCINVYVPAICQHPVFQRCRDLSTDIVGLMCQGAVKERVVASAQEVFCEGDFASCVMFLESGTLSYTCQRYLINRTVTDFHFITEAALWINWVHCGRLTAKTVCDMFEVNASNVHKSLRGGTCDPIVMNGLRKYAAQYAQRISDGGNYETAQCEPVTDLMLPLDELSLLTEQAFVQNRGSLQSNASQQKKTRTGHGFLQLLRTASGSFYGRIPGARAGTDDMR